MNNQTHTVLVSLACTDATPSTLKVKWLSPGHENTDDSMDGDVLSYDAQNTNLIHTYDTHGYRLWDQVFYKDQTFTVKSYIGKINPETEETLKVYSIIDYRVDENLFSVHRKLFLNFPPPFISLEEFGSDTPKKIQSEETFDFELILTKN